MIIRSKAPLRLGLAGGGTDVSPYSELYGGNILNATINMYAYTTIEVNDSGKIVFEAKDIGEKAEYASSEQLAFDGKLDLFKGIYNRIVRDFAHAPLSFTMTTYSDAASGSGLGGSSTLVVSILKAFVEWLGLPLGEYDIAHLAYEIERIDVGLSGGKQDQYAATFGGFNFMEFYKDDKVIVNPLRVKNWIINELESSMLLYFTGTSRESAKIIDEQVNNAKKEKSTSLDAMHQLKKDAIAMKEALLLGDVVRFADILDTSWQTKKRMAQGITNPAIDEVYDAAKASGAYAGKVSGAGGGGFMMFVVDPVRKLDVIRTLQSFGGTVHDISFTKNGTQAWRI